MKRKVFHMENYVNREIKLVSHSSILLGLNNVVKREQQLELYELR